MNFYIKMIYIWYDIYDISDATLKAQSDVFNKHLTVYGPRRFREYQAEPWVLNPWYYMMTSSIGNIFRVILWSASEQTAKQTIDDNVLLVSTVAYLGHGEKTNYSANPPGRNTNPPGRNNQSARAE